MAADETLSLEGACTCGAVRFVRVGTLNEPDRLPPDIHIFTSSKQPWVVLPPNTPAVAEYYDRSKYWPKESLERRSTQLATRPSGAAFRPVLPSAERRR